MRGGGVTELNNDQLRQHVQRLNEAVDVQQGTEKRLRARMAAMEQQLVTKQAEIDSLRVLPNENNLIRDENVQLREKIRELELSASRIVETATYTTESQASLGVKLQAYQRHNNFLQGELSSREAKLKVQQEKLEILAEELQGKDRRITIMVEKLRNQNIDPSTSEVSVHVPQEVYQQMKHKLHSQGSTIEALHEKVESLQDDTQRKEVVVEALQRENKALRQSVSRLIAQINGVALPASPDSDAGKLRAYRQRSASRGGAASPTF
jgi:chromosome segregation ATPase